MSKEGPSEAQLKRDLDQLGKDLMSIDLQIQRLQAGQQHSNIPIFEAIKFEIQKKVV